MYFLFGLISLTCQLSAVLSHMSMQFPYPRDLLNGASYAVWEQNEPMYSVHPSVCHGLDADTTIRTGNSFSAGDYMTIDIYGSAPHNGGHCSFWWTTDTSSTWYKIIDVVDCTLLDTFTVMLPYTMDTACETSCTFAWTWSPVSSALCEVYMNCAEISVSGVTGLSTTDDIITLNIKTDILDADTCVRVDETTHYTTMFSTVKTDYTTDDTNGDTDATDTVIVVDDEIVEEEIETSDGSLCTNSDAPNINGEIGSICGTNCDSCRCDDNQCCSSSGYCGPELIGYDANNDPIYYDYDTSSNYDSETAAFSAYCDNNQGDWRLVPCSDTPTPTVLVETSADNIAITNYDGANAWWYAFDISNIKTGYDIDTIEIRDNSVSASWVEGSDFWGSYLFESSSGFELSIDVRITSTSGDVLTGYDVITNFDSKTEFDFGSNFDGSSAYTIDEESKDNSNHNSTVIIIVVVLIVVLIIAGIIGGIYYVKRRNKMKKEIIESQVSNYAAPELL